MQRCALILSHIATLLSIGVWSFCLLPFVKSSSAISAKAQNTTANSKGIASIGPAIKSTNTTNELSWNENVNLGARIVEARWGRHNPPPQLYIVKCTPLRATTTIDTENLKDIFLLFSLGAGSYISITSNLNAWGEWNRPVAHESRYPNANLPLDPESIAYELPLEEANQRIMNAGFVLPWNSITIRRRRPGPGAEDQPKYYFRHQLGPGWSVTTIGVFDKVVEQELPCSRMDGK